MHVLRLMPIGGNINFKDLGKSFFVTIVIFSLIFITAEVYASTVTLSVVVQTSLTAQISTNNFSTIQTGSAALATSTLAVTTNDLQGWNVTLSGDNKATGANNLQLSSPTTTASIPDQTEWVPGAATTSAGNAARITGLLPSSNVLAFRVMSASSTNGTPFLSTVWWGTADNYTTDSANTLWAGISSSTVQRSIGTAGNGSYSATAHLNTVEYYLSVAATQQTGTYNAPITYTVTGN